MSLRPIKWGHEALTKFEANELIHAMLRGAERKQSTLVQSA
ncbi:chemotaxis protein CheV [Photobacterium aphoticum]|uniref:Chemotaxis protein CheV n=1 Tax=Photobacterium aphoticum TaxID=754436 RepID=A0A090QH00_9GAMM|nr:chemotaxis protein CheV [Photobacterium aphoticum]